MCVIHKYVPQVGGYKTPFISAGLCILVAAVPCTFLIRKISKFHAALLSASNLTTYTSYLFSLPAQY